jgi:hypothetical protein
VGLIDFILRTISSWLTPDPPDGEFTIRQGFRVPACTRCGVEVKNFEERNVVDMTEPGDTGRRIVRFGLICDSCLEVGGKVHGSGGG